MKIKPNIKYTTIALYALAVICLSITFYLAVSRMDITASFLNKLKNLLLPFAYGFSFAYIINPMFNWYENSVFDFVSKKKDRPRIKMYLSLVFTYLTVFVIALIFIKIILPQFSDSVVAIKENVQQNANNIIYTIKRFAIEWGMPPEMVNAEVNEIIAYASEFFTKSSEFISKALPYVFDITKNFATTIINIVIGIIVSVYVLTSKKRIISKSKKFIYAFFPKASSDRFLEITRKSNATFSGFITGKIIDSAIIGLLCFVCMLIFRFPYPVMISVIVGVTNVIPYFGPLIGAIPCVLIILLIDPLKGVGFGIFILVLQQIDGNIIGPKILGQSTGLSPMWVMFAVIVGGGLFGFMGMFVGVPVFAVVYSLVNELINNRLKKRGLSTEEKDYLKGGNIVAEQEKEPASEAN